VGATSAVKSAILTNGTSSTLNIASIGLGGANTPDFLQWNNCGSTLAAGASCTINVTFSVASSGSRSAFVAVTDDAHGSPQMVSLSGTTTDDGAAASLTPSSPLLCRLGNFNFQPGSDCDLDQHRPGSVECFRRHNQWG
jgi:hypothetical protein